MYFDSIFAMMKVQTLPNTAAGIDEIVREIAQGIGHNLGLEHSGANGNLMQENSDGTSLEQYQIDILRESRFTGAR